MPNDVTNLTQTKISDLVQIAPEDFSKHSIVAIQDNINAKYSNKVRLVVAPDHLPSLMLIPKLTLWTGHPENRTLHMSI